MLSCNKKCRIWSQNTSKSRRYIAQLPAVAICLLSILPATAKAEILRTDFQDTQPKYIKTEAGFEGICVDILKLLQQRLKPHGFSIRFPDTFTPIKRIRSNLAKGISDLHCGAARTKPREKVYSFSELPLYSINTVLVGRANESLEVHSIGDLIDNQARTSSVYGTNTYKYLTSQDGVVLGPMPKEPIDGLSLVEVGRTRFFAYHDLGIRYMIKQMGKGHLFKIQPTILRHYNHWMMYNPELDEQVRVLIDKELKELHKSGAIRAIIESYT